MNVLRLVTLVAILVAPAAQSTGLWHAFPGGVTIDLALLAVLAAGFALGPVEGACWGLLAGLLMASGGGAGAGAQGAIYSLAGALAAAPSEIRARSLHPVTIVVVFAITTLHGVVEMGLSGWPSSGPAALWLVQQALMGVAACALAARLAGTPSRDRDTMLDREAA